MSATNFVELDQLCRWHGIDSLDVLQKTATERILLAANKAIAERGAFHLVLAGGTTPRRVYEMLAVSNADWAHWHIYFGDERCLPATDPERNSLMAAQAWLDRSAIPRHQIFPIPAEQGPQAAAAAYSASLQRLGNFDLVLLGLGEDGHTASLFPGHPFEVDNAAAIAVFDAPKPPPERVSLSASRLAKTRQLIFLVTGAGKRTAVDAWRQGQPIPASQIKPACGVDVFIESQLLAL